MIHRPSTLSAWADARPGWNRPQGVRLRGSDDCSIDGRHARRAQEMLRRATTDDGSHLLTSGTPYAVLTGECVGGRSAEQHAAPASGSSREMNGYGRRVSQSPVMGS